MKTQTIKTKNNEFKLTIHSLDRIKDHKELANLDLEDALKKAKLIQHSNVKKFEYYAPGISRVFFKKQTEEPYTIIYANTYYDVQFRVDSRTKTIMTICPLSTQF